MVREGGGSGFFFFLFWFVERGVEGEKVDYFLKIQYGGGWGVGVGLTNLILVKIK
jgi:hypothetical protein